MNKFIYVAIFTTSILLASLTANAAKVVKVKGKKVYISLSSSSEAQKGDVLLVKTAKGKSIGSVKIMRVKGRKALGRLTKGKVKKGLVLKMSGKNRSRTANKSEGSKKDPYDKLKKTNYPTSFYGVMAGFATNNMTAAIKQGSNPTIDSEMSGSGFSGRIFFDYSLWPSIWFRGMLGLENFAAEGDSKICGANNDEGCDVEISYMSLDLWGRWVILQGSFRPWLGVGFNLMFPSSKASTAIDDETITSTSVIAPGLGFDWFFKKNMFIPVQLEYGIYPNSNTVSANYMAARFGVGLHF